MEFVQFMPRMRLEQFASITILAKYIGFIFESIFWSSSKCKSKADWIGKLLLCFLNQSALALQELRTTFLGQSQNYLWIFWLET